MYEELKNQVSGCENNEIMIKDNIRGTNKALNTGCKTQKVLKVKRIMRLI